MNLITISTLRCQAGLRTLYPGSVLGQVCCSPYAISGTLARVGTHPPAPGALPRTLTLAPTRVEARARASRAARTRAPRARTRIRTKAPGCARHACARVRPIARTRSSAPGQAGPMPFDGSMPVDGGPTGRMRPTAAKRVKCESGWAHRGRGGGPRASCPRTGPPTRRA